MKYSLVLVALFPISLLAAQPYELKGNRLGMTVEDFKTRYEHAYCKDANEPGAPEIKHTGQMYCNQVPLHMTYGDNAVKTTLAGVNVSITYSFLPTDHKNYENNILYRMFATFNKSELSTLEHALTKKYGKPKIKTKKRYQRKLVIWSNGTSELSLSESNDDPNQARLMMSLLKIEKEYKRRYKSARAKDI